MRFTFCPDCGQKLDSRPMGDDGETPYCEKCKKPWFDMFSCAVLTLIVNEYGEAALLRQNYISEKYFNLISGYMQPGERAEEAAVREVREEIGIEPYDMQMIGTYWFSKKDMLMIGFIGSAQKADFRLSKEVDGAEWVAVEEAIDKVHPKGSVSYALLDEYLKRSISEKFIEEIKPIEWFKNSGKPTEKYTLLTSVYEAYDNWNAQYLAVWEPQITALEKLAEHSIGGDAVDDIFETVAMTVDEDIQNAWQTFRERGGLSEQNALDEEMTEMVKRDLCWAAVEKALKIKGFFTELLEIYANGYFPVAWDGEYPYGRAAVM